MGFKKVSAVVAPALCFEGVSTCHSFDPSVVYKKRREEERKGASAWGSLLCGPCCGVEGGRASPSQRAPPQPRSLSSDLLACYPPVRKLGPSQIPIPTEVPPRPPPTGPSQAETALPLRVAWGPPETSSEGADFRGRRCSPGLLCDGYSPFLASCKGHLSESLGPECPGVGTQGRRALLLLLGSG